VECGKGGRPRSSRSRQTDDAMTDRETTRSWSRGVKLLLKGHMSHFGSPSGSEGVLKAQTELFPVLVSRFLRANLGGIVLQRRPAPLAWYSARWALKAAFPAAQPEQQPDGGTQKTGASCALHNAFRHNNIIMCAAR
jgi:hypothetical protein